MFESDWGGARKPGTGMTGRTDRTYFSMKSDFVPLGSVAKIARLHNVIFPNGKPCDCQNSNNCNWP